MNVPTKTNRAEILSRIDHLQLQALDCRNKQRKLLRDYTELGKNISEIEDEIKELGRMLK